MALHHGKTVNSESIWVNEIQGYAVAILNSKAMRLSTSEATSLPANVSAYELENPYTIVLSGTIKLEMDSFSKGEMSTRNFRMNVTRDDIARELRRWLDGKEVEHACLGCNKQVESNMLKYIKFGNIPPKENLIMWILSRSEISKGYGETQILQCKCYCFCCYYCHCYYNHCIYKIAI
jgi:hypothetical protein